MNFSPIPANIEDLRFIFEQRKSMNRNQLVVAIRSESSTKRIKDLFECMEVFEYLKTLVERDKAQIPKTSQGLTCPNCNMSIDKHQPFCAVCGQRIYDIYHTEDE